MTTLAFLLVALPIAFFVYAYVVYPLILRLIAAVRPPGPRFTDPLEWPSISITARSDALPSAAVACTPAVTEADMPRPAHSEPSLPENGIALLATIRRRGL